MLSNEYVGKILDDIRDGCWIAAHFDNPSLAGAYASECAGGGYSRQIATFTEPASRTIWVTNPILFTGMLRTRVTHICGWNAQREGDLMFTAELGNPVNVADGGGFQIVAGDIAVSIA